MKILEILKRTFCDMFFNNLLKDKYHKNISEQDKLNIRFKIAEYNLERIIPLAFIILLFQLSNLVVDSIYNPYEDKKIYFLFVAIILIIISVFFLWLVNRLLAAKEKSIKKIEYTYRSFWAVFALIMLGFSAKDIMFFSFPVNSILFCGAIAIVPILSLIEVLTFLLPNMLFTLVMLIVSKAQLQIIVGFVLIYIACFLLSIAIHHTYVNAGIKMLLHTQKIEDLNEKLLQQSRLDCLTRLLNRKGLKDNLEVAWACCKKNSKNAWMILFDIDFFKDYNDTYGHYEGDVVLQKIACCIKSCFERDTDIICRVGGEEFLIFLSNVKEEDVLKLIFEVRKQMEALKIKAGNPNVSQYLTFSIGMASSFPRGNDNPKDLFVTADKALYIAKANGRNCVVYNNKIVFA
jgi:diguanylate cyclase (GGDEF)-like protein